MVKCPVCGLEVEKPFRVVDPGYWSLSIIRSYECCDRKFRVYVRKSKDSLSKELNKGKTMKRYTWVNSEPVAQWDEEDEWSSEESFNNEGEW